jgi:hypothetical protein
MVEVLGATAPDLEEVIVISGDMVTLANLLHFLDSA